MFIVYGVIFYKADFNAIGTRNISNDKLYHYATKSASRVSF